MKKTGLPILFLVFVTVISFSCKKEEQKPKEDVSLAKKYARYPAWVYKDVEQKKTLALLAKAEPVDLLGTEKLQVKNSDIEMSKVKLSDDSIGYIKSSLLADKPIVFIEDTKCHVRNNIGSKVYHTIPRGTIGFVISEKGEWVQIFVGSIIEGSSKKWIDEKWINGGYSTDQNLVLDARAYEDVCAILNAGPEKLTSKKLDEVKEKLDQLAGATNLFSELAKTKREELDKMQKMLAGDSPETPLTEDKKEPNSTDKNPGE